MFWRACLQSRSRSTCMTDRIDILKYHQISCISYIYSWNTIDPIVIACSDWSIRIWVLQTDLQTAFHSSNKTNQTPKQLRNVNFLDRCRILCIKRIYYFCPVVIECYFQWLIVIHLRTISCRFTAIIELKTKMYLWLDETPIKILLYNLKITTNLIWNDVWSRDEIFRFISTPLSFRTEEN